MNNALANVPILIVNVHSRCNCRCAMCDIWKNDVSREFPPDQLSAQLPDMIRLGVTWVVFSGGEPLMHSGLFSMAAMLRQHGIRVTILTTGLLLARYVHDVANNIDDLIVSLDGPPQIHDRIRGVKGAFEQVRQGLAQVLGIRPELRASGRCTVQKLNHAALLDTVQAAKRLGLQSLSFLGADLTTTAFRRDPPWPRARQDEVALNAAELDVLEQEIAHLIAEPEPFVTDRPAHLRRIVHHFRAHLGLEEPYAPHCNAPWVSAVIEADGTVRPCFFHKAIGNVASGPLMNVLNGPTALAFRDTLQVDRNMICRDCVCSIYHS